MTPLAIITKLQGLARINHLGGKGALADTLDETVEILMDAERLVRNFPVLIFRSPGSRTIVGATDSGEYAFRLGEWTRLRDAFLEKASKL